MASGKVIYEYTDAQGGTHRVGSLSLVPKDRLQHMLVIGDEGGAEEGAVAAPPPRPAAAPALSPQVLAVSGGLLLVGLFSKRFMLRVICICVGIMYLLYNGYDVFMGSKYARTAERDPKKAHVESSW